MAFIKVKYEDGLEVFKILINNGKFMGLMDNCYNIIENSEKSLKEIKEAGIELLEERWK